ncbi:GtrA family protein [Tessaracoccus caeni]|uniref:GtrA family protein n=1 Tax=Tessaracoccus caeni TaxID=3031239 RepID=UPI0023DCA8FD|nr:GtrA family protein [Tessaracoccus caeni]MDF1489737.1 GtrA family protein [Tessaracoccus caeni]
MSNAIDRHIEAFLDRFGPTRRLDKSMVRQATRFAAMGLASSILQAGIYLLVRVVASASISSAVSLILSTMANTAMNRAVTFDVKQSRGTLVSQLQGVVLLGITWGFQQIGLALIEPLALSTNLEAVAVVLCGMLGGVLRFTLMRVWMFAPQRPAAVTVAA